MRLPWFIQAFGRRIALVGRRNHSIADCSRVLDQFGAWTVDQDRALPPASPRDKAVLIIRLDDIGDYLLFRNQLALYKRSARWRGHEITLLANDSWRDLFLALDADAVDSVIWVDKHRYLYDEVTRNEIWRRVRAGGFSTVIAASRTRPLLLDDLCMRAAGAPERLGVVNTHVHAAWNALSDRSYTALFAPSHALQHEFHFNAEFSEWACGMRSPEVGPHIAWPIAQPADGPYIICFVGASVASKRWPSRRWSEFIALYRRRHVAGVILAGNGPTELRLVQRIRDRVAADSITGEVSLPELLTWIAGAAAVVTNDTMTAHMGAALGIPTVIIANGINYMRFSEYRNAGVASVATVYPEAVNRRRRRHGDGLYGYSEAVTADIVSISAASVLHALDGLLARAPTARHGFPLSAASRLSVNA